MNKNYFVKIKNNRGVALVSVLLVFVFSAILISSIGLLLNANYQRSSGATEEMQAYFLCLSGEEIARQILDDDYKKSPTKDHVNEKWATYNQSIDVENGYIEIDIVDAQSLFNINNIVLTTGIVDLSSKADFSKLIDYTLKNSKLSSDISDQLVDWIDADKAGVAESQDYAYEDIPYQTPNFPVSHFSEIRLLKEMDRDLYASLYYDIMPAITVLPSRTQININTVNPAVLGAMTNIDIQQARQIVRAIRSKSDGFSSVSDALQVIPPSLHASIASKMAVSSSYFEVRIRAKFGDRYGFMKSLVYRDAQNNGKLKVLSRDRSQRFIFPFSKDYNESAHSDLFDIDI